MNLQSILAKIETYKQFLQTEDATANLYLWESLHYFQANWDTEAMDLASMYDASLQNMTTRRQWKGSDFYPKEMMLKFIQTEPEYVRLAFRDLFNNDKSIDSRVSRFLFYCDELLNIYKEKNPKATDNDHYHNHEVVMMYLAYRFPEQYSLYHKTDFERFLHEVSAKNISSEHDVERFAKITKTVSTFLKKDEIVQELLSNRFEDKHYQAPNVLAVGELMSLA